MSGLAPGTTALWRHALKRDRILLSAWVGALTTMVAASAFATQALYEVTAELAAAAKVIKSFAAEFKLPTVRAGVLDNAALSATQVNELAELPSKDVLRAKLLGLLQTPASQFVRVLNEPGTSLARVLKAKAEAAA